MVEIEEILNSKLRLRILKVLCRENEINITALTRKVNSSHVQTMYHVDFLEKVGFVEVKRYSRLKIVRLKVDNPLVKKLCDILNKYATDST